MKAIKERNQLKLIKMFSEIKENCEIIKWLLQSFANEENDSDDECWILRPHFASVLNVQRNGLMKNLFSSILKTTTNPTNYVTPEYKKILALYLELIKINHKIEIFPCNLFIYLTRAENSNFYTECFS